MNNVHTWLHELNTAWLKEPPHRHGLGAWYLTPAQRYVLLKELMMPLSESRKTDK